MNGGMPSGQVQWSPDGTSIAFVDFDRAAPDAALRVVDAAGAAAPRILDHLHSSIDGGHPRWSSDGKSLLYLVFDGTVSNPRLTTVPRRAGDRRRYPWWARRSTARIRRG